MKKYDMIHKDKLTFARVSVMSLMVLFLTGCWWKSEPKKDETVKSKLVVINVLDKDYYEDCHIAGSINIPFSDFEENLKQLSKENEYVIYCSNYACTAAPFSAKMMIDAGFDKVAVFHGGIVEWYQEEYPCQGPCKKAYLEEENEPFEKEDSSDNKENAEIVDIAADELKVKMAEAGLLS